MLGILCNALICECKLGCNRDCNKLFPSKCGTLLIVFKAGCIMEFNCEEIGNEGICGNAGGICGNTEGICGNAGGICGNAGGICVAPTIKSDEVVFEF